MSDLKAIAIAVGIVAIFVIIGIGLSQ